MEYAVNNRTRWEKYSTVKTLKNLAFRAQSAYRLIFLCRVCNVVSSVNDVTSGSVACLLASVYVSEWVRCNAANKQMVSEAVDELAPVTAADDALKLPSDHLLWTNRYNVYIVGRGTRSPEFLVELQYEVSTRFGRIFHRILKSNDLRDAISSWCRKFWRC